MLRHFFEHQSGWLSDDTPPLAGRHDTDRKGELYTLAASFLWASSFVAVKLGLQHWDPLWFLFWRLLGASLLLPFFVRGKAWPAYLRSAAVWALGFFCAMGYIFQYLGMQHAAANTSAFLINLGIVFVALLSYLLLNEPFGTIKIFGIGLALVGAWLLNGGTLAIAGLTPEQRGNLLVLLGGVFWAFYTVGNKWLLQNRPVQVVPFTAAILFFASLWVLAAALLWSSHRPVFAGDHPGVLIYMIIFCTAIPFLLWITGLKRIQPTVSAALMLTEPVFAAVLAGLLLGERFTGPELSGAMLVLIAVSMISLGDSIPFRKRAVTRPQRCNRQANDTAQVFEPPANTMPSTGASVAETKPFPE